MKKHCRFGQICKYDHFFDCENCENLVYIIKKEARDVDENLKKKDEVISRMSKKIQNLKKDKESLEKKVKVTKNENEKLQVDIRKSFEEKSKLKTTITDMKSEMNDLEKVVKVTKKDFKEKSESQKIKEIKTVNMKILDENYLLKAKLEDAKSSLKVGKEDFENQTKIKESEVKNLKEIIQKLENRVQVVEKKEAMCKEIQLPFPCDKCESTFQTAGLLVVHVKNQHRTMPLSRPL